MTESRPKKDAPKPPTLFEEVASTLRALPDKTMFLVLAAAWVAVFCFLGISIVDRKETASLLMWMYYSYGAGRGVNLADPADDQYGLLVPLLVLIVLWGKREDFLALPRKQWAPALGLLALAMLIHIVGYVVQQPRISIAALFLGIYAIVGIVWGSRWLKAAFMPFSLFIFCEPLSSIDTIKPLTVFLQVHAAEVSGWIAHTVLGFDTVQQGTRIFSANKSVGGYDIVEGCSGIHSLISLFVLMMAFGILTYRSPWRRIVLMIISVPLTVACNILRIVSVISMGEIFGSHASNVAHEWSGYFTYALAIGLMLALSHWWIETPPPAHNK